MKPEWFTEDAIALGVPAIGVAITGVISADYLVAWAIFLAALNLLRAGWKK